MFNSDSEFASKELCNYSFKVIDRSFVTNKYNLISYSAGPIHMRVDGVGSVIIISCKPGYGCILPGFLVTFSSMFENKNLDIKKVSDDVYHVSYDLNIINIYYKYVILYI